jgi:serine/threonine protein kinase
MAHQVLSLDFLIGLDFSHYRIIEEIGSGGIGVVYRAHEAHLDGEIAIKVLSPGTFTAEAGRKHFRKETLALAKLNHPNIATIYDFDTQRCTDFMLMECIPKVTLNDRLVAGPLPENEVLRLGMQLSDGLATAYQRGVAYREPKPGNPTKSSHGISLLTDHLRGPLRFIIRGFD